MLICARLPAIVARSVQCAVVKHELALRIGGTAFREFPQHLIIIPLRVEAENGAAAAGDAAALCAGAPVIGGAIERASRLIQNKRRKRNRAVTGPPVKGKAV